MNESGLTAVRGDAELARRLVDELGVSTSAGAATGGGWGDYLSHLGARAMRAITGLIFDVVEAIPLPPGWPRILAILVVIVALVLLAVVVVRVIRDRRRKRRSAEDGSPEVIEAADDDEAAGELDAAAWRAEVDSLLAAGRIAAALKATWWWLARALAGERADPSWTGRELLAHAGRRDLLPVVRRLEIFTYGDRRPGAAELRGLTDDIAAELGRAGA